MAPLGDYEVVGPTGEFYGRYKTYPPKSKIPLYAMVKKISGSEFRLGEENMFGIGQEEPGDKTGLLVGIGAGALILGAVIYNIVSRMPKTAPAVALGALGEMSKAAQKFIHKKVRILRHEGMPQRQAVAVAYSMARKRGFRSVPRRPRRR